MEAEEEEEKKGEVLHRLQYFAFVSDNSQQKSKGMVYVYGTMFI